MIITKDTARLDKKDIIILIPPWRAPKIIFREFKKHIPKDFGYVDYHHSADIVNSDPHKTKVNVLRYIDTVIAKLKTLNKKKKRNFYIYAESLGVAFAMVMASKILMKKIVLIAPGANLAECFWDGVMTQHLKKEMEKNGMTRDKLVELWKPISPDEYLKGKSLKPKYHLKLARKDITVPYKNGLKLIRLFRKHNVNFSYEVTEVHHIMKKDAIPHNFTVLADAIFPKHSIDFLVKNRTRPK